jgi:hypothetical protein
MTISMTRAVLVRIMIAYLYGPVPLSTEPMKNTGVAAIWAPTERATRQ